MTNNTTFAAVLAALLAERGITAYRLARDAGFRPDFVMSLSKGTKAPSWDTVCRLADTLGVPVEVFRATRPE